MGVCGSKKPGAPTTAAGMIPATTIMEDAITNDKQHMQTAPPTDVDVNLGDIVHGTPKDSDKLEEISRQTSPAPDLHPVWTAQDDTMSGTLPHTPHSAPGEPLLAEENPANMDAPPAAVSAQPASAADGVTEVLETAAAEVLEAGAVAVEALGAAAAAVETSVATATAEVVQIAGTATSPVPLRRSKGDALCC